MFDFDILFSVISKLDYFVQAGFEEYFHAGLQGLLCFLSPVLQTCYMLTRHVAHVLC